jgi:hypothetical protein
VSFYRKLLTLGATRATKANDRRAGCENSAQITTMTYAQELTAALSKLGDARVRIAAQAIGVSKPTIRSWAAGRTEPSEAEKAGALAILAEITDRNRK